MAILAGVRTALFLAAISVLARYEIPSSGGQRDSDAESDRLLEPREIYITSQIDDELADDVMAQLIILDSVSQENITLLVNSPGGSFTALTAIYDTIQYINCRVATVCLGQAAGAAAVLLAAGSQGERAAVPNARIQIVEVQFVGGDASLLEDSQLGDWLDAVVEFNRMRTELARMQRWLEEVLARHSGRTRAELAADLKGTGRILTAEQARDYGLIDSVWGSGGA